MTDRLQLGVIVDQAVGQKSDLHDQDDELIQALHVANVTVGVSLGLLLGDLGVQCIRQVLTGGAGPLGPKPEGQRG